MSASKYVIGLTGGIATGKSHVSGYLQEKGLPVIDADLIARLVTRPGEEGLERIRQHFGEKYIVKGELDRKALGSLVFSSPEDLELLNSLLHPLIIQAIDDEIEKLPQGVLAALDAPLLFETGLESRCVETWAVVTSREEQIRRLEKRDGFTTEEAVQRIDCQMPTQERIKRADRLIDTTGPKIETRQQVDVLLNNLKRRLQLD
ncbi:MAG: dephospho-CoA kinase [Christensenellales bacterium]|jgi:dephospho-CoA kinase|nr:dephospho-CoA kinase [Clostridiales bacterium]